MADELTTVMADDDDMVRSVQSDVCRLPDLCSSMAEMGYSLQTTDAPHHLQQHKLNDVWEGLQTVVQTGAGAAAPVHTHPRLTHPQSQVALNESYYPMPSLKSEGKVPSDGQFQAWLSQHMLSAFGLQDKPNTSKNVYMPQLLETNNGQPAYKSQTSQPTDAGQVTFRHEPSPSNESGHVTLQSQILSDPGAISYRCNTPDLLMSVMQFENQALNSRGSSQWCTPANSPASSPWPSPDSQHHDSDYYSEEPSPQYYCHSQTPEACPGTSMKIPSFIPTFLPHSNSWNWLIQNTTNQKRTESIKDMNPPKIQRLVKGDLSCKSSPPGVTVKRKPVPTSRVYSSPVPVCLHQSEQTMLQSTHTEQTMLQSTHTEQTMLQSTHTEQTMLQSTHTEQTMIQPTHTSLCDRPSASGTTMLPKQFEMRAAINSKPNTQAQKRKASPPKLSKDPSAIPKKKSRHNEPLNNKAVLVMMRWYEDNWKNPYPTKSQKEQLAKEGGISITQVKSWFANKRNRTNNTRPKVQKKQMEDKLMDLCQTLAQDSKQPSTNNAYIIDQLSSIINSRNRSAPQSMQCQY